MSIKHIDKGRLLTYKRRPFIVKNVAFCKLKSHILQVNRL